MPDGALAWAFALACPTCAASVVLTPFEAAGVGGVAAKAVLAAAAAAALAALWAANAWQRRGETGA
jgi:hypothetical protein